ncbi:hypothetical protein GCM10008983_10980 [Lentibacillus halophilus]|uniref:Uncharacterized protein n=1 Tax=Lentibacillus halophilus TaxID=295065 RepID=A0ABN0Z6K4_9BACI
MQHELRNLHPELRDLLGLLREFLLNGATPPIIARLSTLSNPARRFLQAGGFNSVCSFP